MTTRTLKRTNIGHSKSVEALMVRIDWTDAKVVRTEARQDFMLQGATVKILHGEYTPLHDAPVHVKAGQVLYFVQSDGFPGYYYVLNYNEARFAFTCSCPKSYHFHKICGHSQHALAFVGSRYARENAHRHPAAHSVDPEWELPISQVPLLKGRGFVDGMALHPSSANSGLDQTQPGRVNPAFSTGLRYQEVSKSVPADASPVCCSTTSELNRETGSTQCSEDVPPDNVVEVSITSKARAEERGLAVPTQNGSPQGAYFGQYISDELRQAKQELVYEHLASVPLHVEEARVEYARVA